MPAPSELVTFRGGFVAALDVVQRLIDLEARGARFLLLAGGRFKVDPPALLSADDVAFLKARRDEARQVIEYQADDAHLFSDRCFAQPGRLPVRERTA